MVLVAESSMVPVPAFQVPSLFTEMLSQMSEPPEAMFKLPGVVLSFTGPIFKPPLIVTCEPLLKSRVPDPWPCADPPTCRLRQDAFVISTVTIKPPSMITSSPAPGAGLPPQVLEALQFPDWELILVLAATFTANSIKQNKREYGRFFIAGFYKISSTCSHWYHSKRIYSSSVALRKERR
jgi:hypothetical protein